MRHVAGGPARLGERADAAARRPVRLSHRPSAIPARRAHVALKGALALFHGRSEPCLRDGHRKAGRSRRADRPEESDRGRQQRHAPRASDRHAEHELLE